MAKRELKAVAVNSLGCDLFFGEYKLGAVGYYAPDDCDEEGDVPGWFWILEIGAGFQGIVNMPEEGSGFGFSTPDAALADVQRAWVNGWRRAWDELARYRNAGRAKSVTSTPMGGQPGYRR